MSSEKNTCEGDAISSLTSPIVRFTSTPSVLGRHVAGSASIASTVPSPFSARNFSISEAITVFPVPPFPATAMILAFWVIFPSKDYYLICLECKYFSFPQTLFFFKEKGLISKRFQLVTIILSKQLLGLLHLRGIPHSKLCYHFFMLCFM